MIRIIIADDHPYLIRGIKTLLETDDKIEIVGEAKNGEEAIELVKGNMVDIAVLDISMPKMNGIEAAKQIHQCFPRTKSIILSMHANREILFELFNFGIKGYLLKSRNSEELIDAIRKVYEGGTYFNQEVMDILSSVPSFSPKTKIKFTQREKDILVQLGECKSTKEISSELHISPSTVETHIRNMLSKLDIETRMHLVRYAVENGYVKKTKIKFPDKYIS